MSILSLQMPCRAEDEHGVRYYRLILAMIFLIILTLVFALSFRECLTQETARTVCAHRGPMLTIGLFMCMLYICVILGACCLGHPTSDECGPCCAEVDLCFPPNFFVMHGYMLPV